MILILQCALILECTSAAVCAMLLACAIIGRVQRRRRKAAQIKTRARIHRALAVYVGGNQDLTAPRALATAYPGEFEEALQQFQGALGGRCDGTGELAFRLGLVSRWCDLAQQGDPSERCGALAKIACVAHFTPVYRLARDVAEHAVADSDERVRLAGARVLLHSGESWQIARLFQRLLSDTRLVRFAIGPELRHFAPELCRNVVPEILRNARPREIVSALELLASWERGLPLGGLAYLALHPDATVRVQFMRVLPLLPAGPEYRPALLSGLADSDSRVRAAAIDAALRMNVLRNPDPVISGAFEEALSLAGAGGIN